MPKPRDPDAEEFPELCGEDDFAAAEASLQAIRRLQAKGIDVFYFDAALNLEVMERPNGQRFAIRYTGKPNADFEVLEELEPLFAFR